MAHIGQSPSGTQVQTMVPFTEYYGPSTKLNALDIKLHLVTVIFSRHLHFTYKDS